MSELPSTGFIRQAQIIPGIVPVGSTTLWRWVREGKFPKPIKLSCHVTVWRVEDIRSWSDAQQVSP